MSVQPFRLVARLASFAPTTATPPSFGDGPLLGSIGTGSGTVPRRLGSWLSRPVHRNTEWSFVRSTSLGRSLASQPSEQAPPPRRPARGAGLAGGNLPEDTVAEHHELDHAMSGSQHHEVQLLSMVHGIDLNKAQREQAARLAQLYEEHDPGLSNSQSMFN